MPIVVFMQENAGSRRQFLVSLLRGSGSTIGETAAQEQFASGRQPEGPFLGNGRPATFGRNWELRNPMLLEGKCMSNHTVCCLRVREQLPPSQPLAPITRPAPRADRGPDAIADRCAEQEGTDPDYDG